MCADEYQVSGGCEECHERRSAMRTYRRGLEAGIRRATQLNTSEAWGDVASLKARVWRLEEGRTRHCREAHGDPRIT
jgi:hypothetical protein